MKSKPATKSIALNADRVIRKVAPNAAPKAAAVRRPRARQTATAPAVVTVAIDTANGVANGLVTSSMRAAVPSDRIAIRAYELFVAHGFEHGRDLAHWLAAEHELLARTDH